MNEGITLPEFPKLSDSPKMKLLSEIHKEIQQDFEDKSFIEELLQNLWDKWHDVDISSLALIKEGILKLKKKRHV